VFTLSLTCSVKAGLRIPTPADMVESDAGRHEFVTIDPNTMREWSMDSSQSLLQG
jgi:hypothetical protein